MNVYLIFHVSKSGDDVRFPKKGHGFHVCITCIEFACNHECVQAVRSCLRRGVLDGLETPELLIRALTSVGYRSVRIKGFVHANGNVLSHLPEYKHYNALPNFFTASLPTYLYICLGVPP